MDQDLVQYLDERFQAFEGRFDYLEQRFQHIDERFQHIDERFDRQEQRFNARFEQLDERIEEVKRHSGVLVEGLLHEVQLLAEGFATFIEVRYSQDQAKIDRRFDETNVLIRSSYDHLR